VEIKLRNNTTRVSFREVHLTKRCPRCFAAIGSRCRRLDGTALTGTHTERAKSVRDSEAEKVKKQ
jgi:hypothetical protein